MITEAHARCAGAARTNCSVGVSEEFIQRFEAEKQRDEAIVLWVVVCFAVVYVAILAYVVVSELNYRRTARRGS